MINEPFGCLVLDRQERTAERRFARGERAGLSALWQRHALWLERESLRLAGRNRDLAEEALGELGAKLARPKIVRTYQPERSWKLWVQRILKNVVIDLLRRNYAPRFRVTKQQLALLRAAGVPEPVLLKLEPLAGSCYWSQSTFQHALKKRLAPQEFHQHGGEILKNARCRDQRPQPLSPEIVLADRSSPQPFAQAVWNEFSAAIHRGLDELPAQKRAIFIMHHFLGWSFARIAEVLYGKRNSNMVSRPYYRAKALLKAGLEAQGFGPMDGQK